MSKRSSAASVELEPLADRIDDASLPAIDIYKTIIRVDPGYYVLMPSDLRDEVVKALRVPAQLQPHWQMIETAPKGDSILAYFGPENEGWFKCRLNDDRYAARGPKPYWEPAEARYLGITWARKNQPKVWMPLPATPALPSPDLSSPEKDSPNAR